MKNWMTMMGCLAFVAMPATAQLEARDADDAAGDAGPITHEGTLERGDEVFDGQNGHYVDHYTFEVEAGQFVTIDLTSDELDTLVILESPDGQEWVNDDHDGILGHSRISTPLSEAGPRRRKRSPPGWPSKASARPSRTISCATGSSAGSATGVSRSPSSTGPMARSAPST